MRRSEAADSDCGSAEVGGHRQWPLVVSIEEDHALAPPVRVLVSSWPEALRGVELADIEIGDLVHDTPHLCPVFRAPRPQPHSRG